MDTFSNSPLTPGTHTIDIDGTAQRYHVHGIGPTCVAHPGGRGVYWEYLRMPALERQMTMVYVEPIGTGGSGRLSSHPHGYTRERHTRSVIGVLDHLGIPQAHLLGHSHRGFVAQHCALRHPDRVAGVVLYESAPLTGPEHMAEAAVNVGNFAKRNVGNAELPGVLAALQSTSTISNDDEFVAAVRGLYAAYFADYWGREGEFGLLRGVLAGSHISSLDEQLVPEVIDDRDGLGSLAVPALVIVGRYDVVCGVRWARALDELIPDSRLVILERSGHFGPIEEPDVFAEAVTAFVTASPR